MNSQCFDWFLNKSTSLINEFIALNWLVLLFIEKWGQRGQPERKKER